MHIEIGFEGANKCQFYCGNECGTKCEIESQTGYKAQSVTECVIESQAEFQIPNVKVKV